MNLEQIIQNDLNGQSQVSDTKGNILTISEIITELKRTKESFEINDSLETIWQGEKPYYTQHGMNALDCGYLGLNIN